MKIFETSKIIHLKMNYVHVVYFFDRRLDVMDLVVMKLEEGVVHIDSGGGRLGQEHQDIDQVRPA